MKTCQHVRDLRKVIHHSGTAFHLRGQSARVGIAAHDDNGFSGTSGGVAQVRDAEIAVRRQPMIEFDLADAGSLAASGGAEIQERGRNRFLRLVRLVTGEHDDTRMCFVHFEIRADLFRGHFRYLTGLFHGTILCRRGRRA
jgi:hypothetical protein